MSSSGNSLQRQPGYPPGIGIAYPCGTLSYSQDQLRRWNQSIATQFTALVPPIHSVRLDANPPGINMRFATGRESEMRTNRRLTPESLTEGTSIILLPTAQLSWDFEEGERNFKGSALFARKPGNSENVSDLYRGVTGNTTVRLCGEANRTRLRFLTHDTSQNVVEAFVGPESGWTAFGPDGHMPCLSGILSDVTVMPFDDWLLKTAVLDHIPKLSQELPDISQEIRTHMPGFYWPDRHDSNLGNFSLDYPSKPVALPKHALDQLRKKLEDDLSKIMPIAGVYTGRDRDKSHITIDLPEGLSINDSIGRPLGVGSIKKDDTVLLLPREDFSMSGSRGMRSIGPSLLLVHRQGGTHAPSVDRIYTDVVGSTTLIFRRTQYQQTSRGTRRLPQEVSTSLFLRSKEGHDWVCVTTKPGAEWEEMGRLGHMPVFHGTVECVEACPV